MPPPILYHLVAPSVPRTATLNLSAADSKGFLLVCNKGDRALGIIDPVAGKQIATVPEDGVTGHEVIASPDGKRAYVPIYGDSGVGKAGTDGQLVRIIDLDKRQIVGTVDSATAFVRIAP